MPILEVKNMRKAFGKTEVLKDVSFDLEKGQVRSIIGSSGSGKTTLLRCLNFLEKADGGLVFLDDRLFADFTGQRKYSESEIRAMRLNFGLVFQQFNLFPNMTIKDNIMLAPVKLGILSKEEASQKADELLERIGLGDKAQAYPMQLSGGQKQRLAIARALARKSNILILDDSTSALDMETECTLLKNLKENWNSQATTFIVGHRSSAVEYADIILFM